MIYHPPKDLFWGVAPVVSYFTLTLTVDDGVLERFG